ncbi:uncharacterized protein LOC117588440 isoform X1 [Drosophila guanche]|nr:uncharacterized protein LOC117588440 isoform X1 [Drosophila guanche]
MCLCKTVSVRLCVCALSEASAGAAKTETKTRTECDTNISSSREKAHTKAKQRNKSHTRLNGEQNGGCWHLPPTSITLHSPSHRIERTFGASTGSGRRSDSDRDRAGSTMWLYASLLSSSSSFACPCPFLVLQLVLLTVGLLPLHVTARFLCEGGHICSLPRDCCTQGCCPPYQGGSRPLAPPSEHVLNLFFISHWFFWCVVVAIILAILCAYSLWKKRRTLCGWGFNEHHTQSEGDSAGSCYAPPQYSRCSSFHHPPPPYTEVTSKPDLYPLVFTCNSDNGNGKGNGNGSSSYLMVQYFRNYIVRPAGSLSAASTVDSLSSSFICNANEANTMVPPPYSRAASPDLGLHHYLAHAHVAHGTRNSDHTGAPQPPLGPTPLTAAATHQYGLPRSASQLVDPDMYLPRQTAAIQSQSQSQSRAHALAQAQAQAHTQHYATVALGSAPGCGGAAMYSTRLHGSHEDGVSAGAGVGYLQSQSDQHFRYMANSSSSLSDIFVNNSCVAGLGGAAGGPSMDSVAATQAASLCSLAVGGGSCSGGCGGTPVLFSNGCIQPNPLHSLENCCQHSAVGKGDRGGGPNSGVGPVGTASTASGVSSLANVGTPGSPPQATSPTGEVREILDQIRHLQAGVSYEHLLLSGTGMGAGMGAKPRLQHTLSTPSSSQAPQPTAMSVSVSASGSSAVSAAGKSKKFFGSNKMPPPPNKALYIPMAAMGAGMGTAQRCLLKSPVSSVVSGASFFVNRGRVARKGWITRSAPTTPGSALPPSRLGDDSPLLLNEHDEDAIDDDEGLDTETETETEAETHERQPQHRNHRHGQLE